MKKNVSRALSFVLVLLMVLTALPVYAIGETAREVNLKGIGDWFVKPTPVESGSKYPAQTITAETGSGVRVTVDAPAGALPARTTMTASAIANMDAVQAAVDQTEGVSGTVLTAVDITFYCGGVEIQPAKDVVVSITSDELSGMNDLSVVHLDVDADELEGSEDAEPVENAQTNSEGVLFSARHFSVYAVIGDGGTGDRARLTVNFWDGNGDLITYAIVTPRGIDLVDQTIPDPVVNQSQGSKQFCGWIIGNPDYTSDDITGDHTINYVREKVRARLSDTERPVQEGEVMDVYAMYFNYFIVSFANEDGDVMVHADAVYTRDSAYNYLIPISYTPVDTSSFRFTGWDMVNDNSNKLYQSGEPASITSDTVFRARVQKGQWIEFRENPYDDNDHRGATYVPPVFCPDGVVTADLEPEEPELPGYQFKGWYEDYINGTFSNEFDFANHAPITHKVILNARWEMNPTAAVTVIIWQQNTAGTGYDYVDSVKVTANSKTTISPVSVAGSGNDTYAVIDGTDYKLEGSKVKGIYDKDGYNNGNGNQISEIEVNPAGTSVMNVYYDRNSYKLTFQVPRSFSQVNSPTAGNEYYYKVDSTHYQLCICYNSSYGLHQIPQGYLSTTSGKTYYVLFTDNSVGELYHDSNGWYYYTSNYSSSKTYISSSSDVYEAVSSPFYTASSTWKTIKEITALYGAFIGNYFPIAGTDGVTYDNGERWDPYNSSDYDQVMVYMPYMPAVSVTYHLDIQNRPLKTMNYYVQDINNTAGAISAPSTVYLKTDTNNNTPQTVPSDMKFVLLNSIDARYNGVTEAEDFVNFTGFTKLGAGEQGVERTQSDTTVFYYIWDPDNDGTIDFYYTRNKYNIGFFDGVYLDGYQKPIDDADDRGEIHTVEDVYYEQNISSVLDYTPARAGWKFEGWYFDKGCTQAATLTTMPAHGVSVYAKWQLIQYRAILHPNGGTTSTATDFRVDYKEQVAESIPATREGYELVGWFTDPEFKHPFNFSTLLTDDTTVPYPESEKPQYGDAGRNWITRKIDLYAKWRVKIPGASGITVVYNAIGYDNTPGHLEVDETITTTYTDPLYYLDDSTAIGYSAAEPNNNTDYYFLYWEIMTPVSQGSSELEPSGKKVYPGQKWTVDYEDTVKTVLVDGNMNPVGRGVKAGSDGMRALGDYRLASSIEVGKKYLIVYGNGTTAADSSTMRLMGGRTDSSRIISGTPTFKDPSTHDVITGVTGLSAGTFSECEWTAGSGTITGAYTFNNDGYYVVQTAEGDKNMAVNQSSSYASYRNWYVDKAADGEYFNIHNAYWHQQNSGRWYYLYYSNNYFYNYYMTSFPQTGSSYRMYLYEKVETVYTVTFKDWDGTVLSTQTVDEGSAAVAPADPTREGYEFTGWDVDFSSVTADLEVTATYSQNTTPSGGTEVWVPVDTITDTTKEYLIGIVDGNTTYLIVNKNPNASNNYWYTNYNSSQENVWYQAYLAAAVKDGANVIGVDGVAATDLQYCQWKFSSTSGGVISSCFEEGRYLYGATGISSSSDYYGYTYYDTSVDTSSSSWTYNNHRLYKGSMYVFHRTYTSSSTNITYDLLRGTTTSSSAGYVQLYMKTFVANKHTVTFYEWDNNQNYVVIGTPQSVEEGAHATAPSVTAPNGYIFAGWTIGDGTEIYSSERVNAMEITSDMQFYAQYTTQSGTAVYKVVFVDWDGDILKTEYVVEGGAATAPSNPTRTGYTFTGWDVAYDNITGPLTVTASYSAVQANKYQVTLRAVYKERVQKEYTHIYWYANNETGAREDSGENIQLSMNEAVDIPTPTTYVGKTEAAAVVNGLTYGEDRVFLGWAKVSNTNTGSNSAAYMPDHPELTVDDLFLKWEDGAFKALIPEHPKEGETQEWKVVTKVAADELTPYDDLYAVWGTVIYVYHSADNTVEKVVTTNGQGKAGSQKEFFDITKYVRDGYLYGGYYKNYAGKSTNFEAKNVAANLWTAYTSVAGRDVDTKYVYTDNGTNAKPYISDNGTINVEWNWSESYNIDTDSTKLEPDANGFSIKPVAGTTYFLKEVPDTMYLQPYLHYTYKLGSKKITAAWLISDLDDLNYQETGFLIAHNGNIARVAHSLTIKTENCNTSVTLTPAKVFGSKGVTDGWLSYLQVYGNENAEDDLFEFGGSNYQVRQYWRTPDGLYVTGNLQRTYNNFNYVGRLTKIQRAASTAPSVNCY